MNCPMCNREFKPYNPQQKFCCRDCAKEHARLQKNQRARDERLKSKETAKHVKRKSAMPSKPIADWIREAAECGLDYGTYRALIEASKTFDEIKDATSKRPPPHHARSAHYQRGEKLI